MSDRNAIVKCSTCLNDTVTKTWIFGECLPVPEFGGRDVTKVKVATVGINPSSTEFFAWGKLKPLKERLPALPDYGVTSRNQLTGDQANDAAQRRADYFNAEARRAHDWFVKLGGIVKAANVEWDYGNGSAMHLDIVACVTTQKWTDVNGSAKSKLVANCRDHLERTVSSLPTTAMLLFDGKTACEAMAGEASEEWKQLFQFTDNNGERKTVRARCGTLSVRGEARRFVGWNIPAKFIPEERLARVGEWVRGAIGE